MPPWKREFFFKETFVEPLGTPRIGSSGCLGEVALRGKGSLGTWEHGQVTLSADRDLWKGAGVGTGLSERDWPAVDA